MSAVLCRQGRCSSIPPGRYFRMHVVGYFEGIGKASMSGAAITKRGAPCTITGFVPVHWRQRSGAAANRGCRARFRTPSRPLRRHAPGLVARRGEHPETLPAPCGRIQPRLAHALPNRLRYPTGLGRCLACRHLDRAAANSGLPGPAAVPRKPILPHPAARPHYGRDCAKAGFYSGLSNGCRGSL